MNRIETINYLIRTHKLGTYLEIGVRQPSDCFDQINAEQRWGVDPAGAHSANDEHQRYLLRMTSRAFARWLTKITGQRKRWRPFETTRTAVPKPGQWDLIFIDGDHRYEGARHDIRMAKQLLSPGGCLVCHDVLPSSDSEALPAKPDNGRAWCGEVWRAWDEEIEQSGKWLKIVITDDHGVGVACRGDGIARPAAASWRELRRKWEVAEHYECTEPE